MSRSIPEQRIQYVHALRHQKQNSQTRRQRGEELKYYAAPSIATQLASPSKIPKTFFISGNCGLDHFPLRVDLIDERGFKEETSEELFRIDSTNNHVGVLFLQQNYHYNHKESLRYDPNTSKLTCFVKSVFPARAKQCFTNKENLFYGLSSTAKRFLMPTLTLTRSFLSDWNSPVKRANLLKNLPNVVILKPVGSSAGCGVGIQVVRLSDPDGQENFYKAAIEVLQYPSAIACEYILYPLLFQDRKLHFRMYFLVRSPIFCPNCIQTVSSSRSNSACSLCFGKQPQPFSSMLFPRGRILTARNPYKQDDFFDPSIHDSHIKSTEENYFFPEDLKYCRPFHQEHCYNDQQVAVEGHRLLSQMNTAMNCVSDIIANKMTRSDAWVYPESNFAFEVFGCDFMVRSDPGKENQIILLEVNEKPSSIPCFAGNPPPDWPPQESSWSLSDSTRPSPPWISEKWAAYKTLPAYSSFSNELWQWIITNGIDPFYDYFESQ